MSATTSRLLQYSEYNPTLMPKISLLTMDILESFPKERERFFMPSLLSYFLCFSHDSLHFAMIPLTPSATKTIILGSTTHFPRFGAKNEIYYSPVTIHWYYSLLLFTPNFCLFKGGCPLYLRQVFCMPSSGLLP